MCHLFGLPRLDLLYRVRLNCAGRILPTESRTAFVFYIGRSVVPPRDTIAAATMSIRCHPDEGALNAPPSLMFTWQISEWLSADPPGDYAADIALFGTPEILGTSANLVGMVLVYAMIRNRAFNEYHDSARRCFQWMLLYLLAHAAIHATWGYKFRVPLTNAMNIAFVWMRHHGFTVSWLQSSAEKKEKGRRISEAFAYLLILLNLVVVTPRALTIGITSFLQPLLLWPLRFWVDDWRRPRHLMWLVGFSAMWWTFSFLIKKEIEAGSACTWLNTHLTAEVFGVMGNLSLVVFILKVTNDSIGKPETKKIT